MSTCIQIDRAPPCVRLAHFMISDNCDVGSLTSTGYNRLCESSLYNYSTVNIYGQELGQITLKPIAEKYSDKVDAALNGYVRYVSEEHDKVFWYDTVDRYIVTVSFASEVTLATILRNSFVTASYDWFVQEIKHLEQYMSWAEFVADSEKDFGLEED